MASMLMVVMVAVSMRIAGSAVRPREHPLMLRMCGWVACATAAWLAAAAAGGWVPVWVVVPAGVAAGAVHWQWPAKWLNPAFDAGLIVMFTMMSVPRVDAATIALAAVCCVALGAVIDLAVGQWRANIQRGAFAAQCVAAFAVMIVLWQVVPTMPVYAWHRTSWTTPLHVGVGLDLRSQRVELGGGAVAWLDRPVEQAAAAGAIMFHGSHRDGAHQPAAAVLRRALVDAGFVVLSVDHPGFGQSSTPAATAPVDEWDPLPIARRGLSFLQETIDGDCIIAVGHSMGCIDVLRLLLDEAPIRAGVLFGGGIPQPSQVSEWAERFRDNRNITDPMPIENIRQVRARYYDTSAMTSALPQHHPPIMFVRFGIEHDDVAAGRDALFALIPNQAVLVDFDQCTHYFSAWRRGGILVGDARIARRLSDLLRRAREELAQSGQPTSEGAGE